MSDVISCSSSGVPDIKSLYINKEYVYVSTKSLSRPSDFTASSGNHDVYTSIIRIYHKDVLSIELLGEKLVIKGYSRQDNKDYELKTTIAEESAAEWIKALKYDETYTFSIEYKLNWQQSGEVMIWCFYWW